MRGRYYCFCSGGSIFSVSTVGRSGRRMGKYMRKAKSVQSMEVSQSSLHGVRTRARTLALMKHTSDSISEHSFPSPTLSKPRKSSQSQTVPSKSEPRYMQLRSRRLEKATSRHCEEGKDSAGDGHNENVLGSAGEGSMECSSMPSHLELRLLNEELVDMPARNSCSSRPEFTFAGFPCASVAGIADASHSRATSPFQSSLRAPNYADPVAISTQMQRRGASKMVTRHQKQELDSKLSVDANVMVMASTPEATRSLGDLERDTEVGPCSGESPIIAGPFVRERQQGPNTRSQKQECTPDNDTNNVEVAGSISKMGELRMRSCSASLRRSSEALFTTEMEAFFASAEQKERRRFIERYNFDPLIEKPLKGRYLWFKE